MQLQRSAVQVYSSSSWSGNNDIWRVCQSRTLYFVIFPLRQILDPNLLTAVRGEGPNDFGNLAG
jgi:hypothetical protein